MKVTLTIEVPDDFKKGKCWKCPIKEVDTEYDCISCKVHSWVIHDAFDLDTNQVLTSDCPLEMQENKCSFTPINENSIELKVDDIEPFAKVGRIFVTSPDHWCRTYYDCADCELYEENNQ